MAKAKEIIDRAYSLLGVKAAGEAISGDDDSYALDALNTMLDAWQVAGLYIPYQVETNATITGATATVGTGGDFNITRPVRVKQGFVRISNVDYPFEFLTAREFYDLGQKNLPGQYDYSAYYAPTMPDGTLYFSPPMQGNDVHIITDAQLSAFPDYTTDVLIPPSYKHCLQYCLAIELAPGLREPSQLVIETARVARYNLMKINQEVPMFGNDAVSTFVAFHAGL